MLKKQKNIFLRISGVLLVAVTLSACMLSGLLAKYTSVAENGSSARVAVFSVDASADNTQLLVDLGATESAGQYALKLKNLSEVAVSYDIIIHTEAALPSGAYVKLEGNLPSVYDGGKNLVFSGAGTLGVSASEEKTLVFDADEALLLLGENGESYFSECEFTVTVVFRQID